MPLIPDMATRRAWAKPRPIVAGLMFALTFTPLVLVVFSGIRWTTYDWHFAVFAFPLSWLLISVALWWKK
jgi:hypothetical protein